MGKESIIPRREAAKKMTKKNLYFQRLQFLRYLMAFFFFFNLYWLLAASLIKQVILLIPASMLLFSIGSACEFIRLFGHVAGIGRKQLFFTAWFFRLQLVILVVLFLCTFFGLTEAIFPYITVERMLYIRGGLFLIGLFSCLGITKLNKILRNKDKHWQWISIFEEIDRKGE